MFLYKRGNEKEIKPKSIKKLTKYLNIYSYAHMYIRVHIFMI